MALDWRADGRLFVRTLLVDVGRVEQEGSVNARVKEYRGRLDGLPKRHANVLQRLSDCLRRLLCALYRKFSCFREAYN